MGSANVYQLQGEFEDSFCEENAAPALKDIRAIGAKADLDEQVHVREENIQRLTQYAGHVRGMRSGKLAFEHYLVGDGVELDEGATPTDDPLQEMLTVCMGGSYSDEGSVTAGAPTTTVIDVGAGEGIRFEPGQAVLFEDGGGSGIYEASIIESISTDTLTLAWALSNAPAAAKKVINGYCAYIDPSGTDTYQFSCIGDDNAHEWLLLGCWGGFKLSNLLQVDSVAKLAFDWTATDWEQDTAALATASFEGADPLPTNEQMEILFGNHGTSTRSRLSCSKLEIDPKVLEAHGAYHARGNLDHQGVDRVRMSKRINPTATIAPDASTAYLAAFNAATAKRLTVIIGNTPGQTIVIDLPKVYINTLPKDGAADDQLTTSINLIADEDDAGDASTAIMRSPIRITRL